MPVAAMLVNGSKNEINNLYRGPSIDASYQVSYHLAKQFQRKSCFRNLPIRTKMTAVFVNGSKRNEQFPQRTFHRCFLPCFGSFAQDVSEQKIFQKSTNQKPELPVVAIFVNGSGRIEQSLQWTSYRCILQSLG